MYAICLQRETLVLCMILFFKLKQKGSNYKAGGVNSLDYPHTEHTGTFQNDHLYIYDNYKSI